MLVAAVIVSFHYYGGNMNAGKIGLAIRRAGAYTTCCSTDLVQSEYDRVDLTAGKNGQSTRADFQDFSVQR